MALTTLGRLKSKEFLNLSTDEFDLDLKQIIDSVSNIIETELDLDTAYTIETIPAGLERAVAKQCVYEFRRRNDIGVSSVTFPDGSINKNQIDFLLKDVLMVVKKFKSMELM